MNKLKIILAIILVTIGVIGRFILVSYVGIPNLEIITALALIAGIYLGGVYAIIVPLSIIFFSDLIIGNNYIFIFTWTAFAFIGLAGLVCRKYRFQNSIPSTRDKIQNSFYLAIGSSVFFYLYTNFGWFLMSGMYEYSLSGLLRCYWMAIPFFRNNLIGNLIFVPVGIYVASKVFCGAKEKYFYFSTIKNEKRM